METTLQIQAQESGRMTLQSITAAISRAQAEFNRLNSGRHQNGCWRDLPRRTERLIGERADELARLRRLESWLLVKQLLDNKQFMDGMRQVG
jgi:hypothetical protein